jgi:glyoxylase-like metal-dependent hydrolase (beta-lactamase superfamily II)
VLRATPLGPVTRIRLAPTLAGRPLHQVSVYLLGRLLIDSGPPATARELLAWLRAEGLAERITTLVNTHHHEDHVGGNALLARELGIEVLAPPATAALIARRRRIPLYRALVWGRPAPSRAAPFGAVLRVDGWRFEVIPTPGHAFDHVCLFEPERRWLFSGDLYVHPRVRYLRRLEAPWVQIESLRRVLALGPEILFCAHAGRVEDARGALAEKIADWQRLAAAAAELRARGLSLRAITRRLAGREGIYTWMSLGDFSKRNLIRALLAGA